MFELGVEQARRMPMGVVAAMLDDLGAGEIAGVSAGTAEAMILAGQRVINAASAIQAQAIVALATREREEQDALVAEAQAAGLPKAACQRVNEWEFLGDRIAPLLSMTGRGADTRVELAFELSRRLPRTFAVMRAGDLDPYRAGIIANHAALVSAHIVPSLEEQLFTDVPGAPESDADDPEGGPEAGPEAGAEAGGPRVPDARDLHSTRLRAMLRRLTARLDPQSERRRCERARRERCVSVAPGVEPGITHWTADLPVEDSMKAWAAIDALAHDYQGSDGRGTAPGRRTLAQARADAMLDLLLGNATVSTTMEVVVPVDVLAPDHPWLEKLPHLAERQGLVAPPGLQDPATRGGLSTLAGLGGCARGTRVGATTSSASATTSRGSRATTSHSTRATASRAIRATLSSTTLPNNVIAQTAMPPTRKMVSTSAYIHPANAAGGAASPSTSSGASALSGVEVRRHGVLPIEEAQRLAAATDTGFRALFIDARTGHYIPRRTRKPARDPDGQVVDVGATAYRPNAALDRGVRTRDERCRFPGCSMRAQRCDLDHVVRFPDGPTDESNLHALCRHHHRLKHLTGWTVKMDRRAVCTWTTPTGVRYVTRPADYRDIAA